MILQKDNELWYKNVLKVYNHAFAPSDTMPATPLKKFQIEVDRLKSLCVIGANSFRQSATLLSREIRSGTVNPHQPIQFLQGEAKSIPFNFINRLKSQFPKYLRETLFVRMISALEVFFLDVVREIFLARRDLFYTDQRLDLSYGELLSVESVTQLWSKLINRELRKLQNQGFKEVVKFFRLRFGIDFVHAGVPISTLEEYHERRHLLVHRLGRTDEKYRRRYNLLHKIVSVPEDHFLDCAANLIRLATWVSSAAHALEEESIERAEAESQMRIIVEVISDCAAATLNRDFHYNIEDQIYRLGDLLVSYNVDGPKYELVVSGKQTVVSAYVKILKSLQKNGEVFIKEKEILRYRRLKPLRCNLPPALIKEIWESLPPRPWPRDLHKTIAKDFSISNNQASAALGMFLKAIGP